MLKLSKKVEYAVLALLAIDRDGNGTWMSARDIARRNAIPQGLLGRLLHRMARCGLLKSVKGPKGGFRLNRPLERIALSDVVECVEGPLQLTCCQSDPRACPQFDGCGIRRPVLRVQHDLVRYMSKLSLAAFRPAGKRVRAVAGSTV